MTLHVRGYKFVVRANFSSSKGWHCTRVQCREGDFIHSEQDNKFTDDDNEEYFDCEGDDDEEGGAGDESIDDEDDGDDDDETGTGAGEKLIALIAYL